MNTPSWFVKVLYGAVILLILIVIIFTVIPATRSLAQNLATPLLTAALAVATLLLAMFGQQQATQAKEAALRAQKAERINRHRFLVEHGPQPKILFEEGSNVNNILYTGFMIDNSGKGGARIQEFWIDNHDFSCKAVGRSIGQPLGGFSQNDYIHICDSHDDPALEDIAATAGRNGYFDIRVLCDSHVLPGETIVTEQRNCRDPKTRNWKQGEPITKLIDESS